MKPLRRAAVVALHRLSVDVDSEPSVEIHVHISIHVACKAVTAFCNHDKPEAETERT